MPGYPVALELCPEKLELYIVQLLLASFNLPHPELGFDPEFSNPYTDFKTRALLWREGEFQHFASYFKLPLIPEIFFLYENFCGIRKGYSISFFLTEHHSGVLICVLGNMVL